VSTANSDEYIPRSTCACSAAASLWLLTIAALQTGRLVLWDYPLLAVCTATHIASHTSPCSAMQTRWAFRGMSGGIGETTLIGKVGDQHARNRPSISPCRRWRSSSIQWRVWVRSEPSLDAGDFREQALLRESCCDIFGHRRVEGVAAWARVALTNWTVLSRKPGAAPRSVSWV